MLAYKCIKMISIILYYHILSYLLVETVEIKC